MATVLPLSPPVRRRKHPRGLGGNGTASLADAAVDAAATAAATSAATAMLHATAATVTGRDSLAAAPPPPASPRRHFHAITPARHATAASEPPTDRIVCGHSRLSPPNPSRQK